MCWAEGRNLPDVGGRGAASPVTFSRVTRRLGDYQHRAPPQGFGCGTASRLQHLQPFQWPRLLSKDSRVINYLPTGPVDDIFAGIRALGPDFTAHAEKAHEMSLSGQGLADELEADETLKDVLDALGVGSGPHRRKLVRTVQDWSRERERSLPPPRPPTTDLDSQFRKLRTNAAEEGKVRRQSTQPPLAPLETPMSPARRVDGVEGHSTTTNTALLFETSFLSSSSTFVSESVPEPPATPPTVPVAVLSAKQPSAAAEWTQAGFEGPPMSPASALLYPYAYDCVVLVVGIAGYEFIANLHNLLNDARAIYELFHRTRFRNRLLFKFLPDANLATFIEAIRGFHGAAGRGIITVFYYAEQAVQFDGINYLLPIDFDATSAAEVPERAVSLSWILCGLEGKRCPLNMLIVDACRNSPLAFNENRALLECGLAHTTAPTGSILAFATAPGKVALDYDPGGHGVWTSELLRKAGAEPGCCCIPACTCWSASKDSWEADSVGRNLPRGRFYLPPAERPTWQRSISEKRRASRKTTSSLPPERTEHDSRVSDTLILWQTGPSEPLSALWGWACVRCGLSMRIYSPSVRLLIWRVSNARTW